MEQNLQNQEAYKKLKELVEEVRICMLATTDVENNLYGRPMTTMQVDEQGGIWFFTSRQTESAAEAARHHRVGLNYSHPGKNTYLTVQGEAELVEDRKKMEELWTPMLKAWFPEGLESPDLVLLKVKPDQAHYWDSDRGRLQVLFAMVRAAATGKPASDAGQHGELKV